MSNAFYDSKTRRPKPWIYGFFVILPVIILTIAFFIGQEQAKKKALEKPAVEEDVFDRF